MVKSKHRRRANSGQQAGAEANAGDEKKRNPAMTRAEQWTMPAIFFAVSFLVAYFLHLPRSSSPPISSHRGSSSSSSSSAAAGEEGTTGGCPPGSHDENDSCVIRGGDDALPGGGGFVARRVKDPTRESRDHFYHWRTPVPDDSALRALFPDVGRLQMAWENAPLLSRVAFARGDMSAVVTEDTVPLFYHARGTVSNLDVGGRDGDDDDDGEADDPLLSIFSVDETLQVLSQPMTHGSDYKLVKKIVLPPDHATEAGEEYMGMLPGSHYSVQEILMHFHRGAFSIVVNRLQDRWGNVARFGRMLEDAFGALTVGANLYLTPEATDAVPDGEVRQGFEAHWDWMDVIVVQLSGRKRWSVAKEPSIYLSNKDQKRKPKQAELEQLRRYDDFILCPGDVLYIPRGHVHNASTVILDDANGSSDGSAGALQGCPNPDLPQARLLSERLAGPSLHVTFGLLQSNDATLESLLHHAVDAFFDRGEEAAPQLLVAIPKNTCPNKGRRPMGYDVRWRSVLHHSLAEVARRRHRCDTIMNSPEEGRSAGGRCDGTAVLRRSVSLPPLTYHEHHDDLDESGWEIAKADLPRHSNLRESYMEALNWFVVAADLAELHSFVDGHLLNAPLEEGLNFHYPGYGDEDVMLCPEAIASLPYVFFMQILDSFQAFAEDKFNDAMVDMNSWWVKKRAERRRRQESELAKVGQGEGASVMFVPKST